MPFLPPMGTQLRSWRAPLDDFFVGTFSLSAYSGDRLIVTQGEEDWLANPSVGGPFLKLDFADRSSGLTQCTGALGLGGTAKGHRARSSRCRRLRISRSEAVSKPPPV